LVQTAVNVVLPWIFTRTAWVQFGPHSIVPVRHPRRRRHYHHRHSFPIACCSHDVPVEGILVIFLSGHACILNQSSQKQSELRNIHVEKTWGGQEEHGEGLETQTHDLNLKSSPPQFPLLFLPFIKVSVHTSFVGIFVICWQLFVKRKWKLTCKMEFTNNK
jgi:hypothetical protein